MFKFVHNFRLGRQLGKPQIAHKDRSKRSLNETLDEFADPDSGLLNPATGLLSPATGLLNSGLDDKIECDEENKTCTKAHINPAGNPVRNRSKKFDVSTHKKPTPATSTPAKNVKKVKREIRNVRVKRHVKITEEEDFDVRLCQANRNGTICPDGIDQGFIEIFNKTTSQWVPICDERFSERNAEVVCRQLGFSTLNVYMTFDQRIEYR